MVRKIIADDRDVIFAENIEDLNRFADQSCRNDFKTVEGFLFNRCKLIENIFEPNTPLHDGAVVVRDGRIEAAGCFLPLSNNLEIGKDMGTRHRAALGMSENSDAVVVVVSEETGIISMAKNGVLIRRLDRQNLFNLLQEELVPPETAENQKQPFWRKKHEKEQQRQ